MSTNQMQNPVFCNFCWIVLYVIEITVVNATFAGHVASFLRQIYWWPQWKSEEKERAEILQDISECQKLKTTQFNLLFAIIKKIMLLNRENK